MLQDQAQCPQILTDYFNSGTARLLIHWRKDNDYFTVRMYQDLMGDWTITQSWGNSASEKSAFKHTVTFSFQEARSLLKKINKQRKAKGFQLHKPEETQLGFEFFD